MYKKYGSLPIICSELLTAKPDNHSIRDAGEYIKYACTGIYEIMCPTFFDSIRYRTSEYAWLNSNLAKLAGDVGYELRDYYNSGSSHTVDETVVDRVYYPRSIIELKDLIKSEVPLHNIDLANLDNIDESHLFSSAKNYPSEYFEGVNTWDFTKFTTVEGLFQGCKNFNTELDIDLRNVTECSYMFSGCTNFNKPVKLSLPNCTDTSHMFFNCTNFNSEVKLDIPNLVKTGWMFENCKSLNSYIYLNSHKIVTANRMFSGCSSYNKKIKFDTSKIRNAEGMFRDCKSFNQDLPDMPVLRECSRMLEGCTSFNKDIIINLNPKDDSTVFFY